MPCSSWIPHLQAVHARVPAIAVWDDHEVQNDYLGTESNTGVPEDLFVHRIAVAYRAFYENMPLDIERAAGRAGYRHHHGVRRRRPAPGSPCWTAASSATPSPRIADGQQYPERTMLGTEQEDWVTGRLEQTPATWNVMANGVVLAAIPEQTYRQWDGYPAARQRLLDAMAAASTR